jgi:hypothetical protein
MTAWRYVPELFGSTAYVFLVLEIGGEPKLLFVLKGCVGDFAC